MPQQLIIEPCIVNHGGGEITPHGIGEVCDIERDTAYQLARMGRTLYVDRKDDSDKAGRYTASPEMIKAAEALRKAAGKAPAKPASGESDN